MLATWQGVLAWRSVEYAELDALLLADVARPLHARARWPTPSRISIRPTFPKAINRSTICMLVHQRKLNYARAPKTLNVRRTKYWRNKMSPQWTPERKAKQSQAIMKWKPWEKSTGPRSPDGKARISRNSWKGGQRHELRELTRMVNAELKFARGLV